MPRFRLTPELLIRAYCNGHFPMAEDRHDPTIHWVDPDRRGILPLDRFHLPKRLARTMRKNPFSIRVDTAFRQVVLACAEPASGRNETWINDDIIDAYCGLHAAGFAHSVECWIGSSLVGGLYGVSIGGAFFGESMFHTVTDASKVALAHLVERLRAGGYRLLDTQFVTQHLIRFGAIEIPRHVYLRLLADALTVQGRFYSWDVASSDGAPPSATSRHSMTEMS
ncbi:MAG: leucyl/phenylalanyl-tRNA--protein transferase [Rhodospirillaceae bacterium]|nr:leucyl/phenylalanyl-tRNA--protein transferase [Rhodospirillaceae bacterium]|tara:strand:+ start:81 stop:752 length:672 start_codon:yes stop_codon:yes gene_type:complete